MSARRFISTKKTSEKKNIKTKISSAQKRKFYFNFNIELKTQLIIAH